MVMDLMGRLKAQAPELAESKPVGMGSFPKTAWMGWVAAISVMAHSTERRSVGAEVGWGIGAAPEAQATATADAINSPSETTVFLPNINQVPPVSRPSLTSGPGIGNSNPSTDGTSSLFIVFEPIENVALKPKPIVRNNCQVVPGRRCGSR